MGLVAFTKTIAKEGAKYRIKASVIAPVNNCSCPGHCVTVRLSCELGEFVSAPNADACPVLILPTEEGRAATETGLDEDKSVPSTLSFAVAETATSTKVCQVEEGKG